jgi:hypothetical protein
MLSTARLVISLRLRATHPAPLAAAHNPARVPQLQKEKKDALPSPACQQCAETQKHEPTTKLKQAPARHDLQVMQAWSGELSTTNSNRNGQTCDHTSCSPPRTWKAQQQDQCHVGHCVTCHGCGHKQYACVCRSQHCFCVPRGCTNRRCAPGEFPASTVAQSRNHKMHCRCCCTCQDTSRLCSLLP